MYRTAVGEQWGVRVSVFRVFRARKPRTLPVTSLSTFVVVLAGILFISPFAQAQEEATEGGKGLDTTVESLAVADQSLQDIVSLLSEYGQTSINVAATAPQVRVALNIQEPRTIRQILDDLSNQYGLWIDYQSDNTFVRSLADKPAEEETYIEKDFPLNFSRPSEIVDLVSNLLSDRPQADALALDSLRVIRVRDIPEAVSRIEEFLGRVDIPQQSTVFRILYGDPELIAEIIQERIPDLEEGAITVDITNSQLIVRTTLDKLQEIQLLIETLDIKKEIRIFHIGFHPVEDVITILEDLDLLSEEATITSNEFTGKLIIQDTPERLDRIAEAIRAYDQPRPMVFFEAEILDVNADYNFNWNPTLALRDAALGTNATGTTALTDGDTAIQLAGSGAFNVGTLNAGDYLAQLQADENDSDVNTIASPRVLVEMQEEARLNVGSEEPYGVRSFTNSGFGNTNDIVTQRVREVGVRLIIFVRNISERGYVEFEVGLENSSDGGRIALDNQGTTGLRVLTTNVETVALVKDNRTLVLGGLVQRRESETNAGIPFLNKVPGIRYIFSTMARSDTRRKLLLFLTPHILNIDFPHDKYMEDDEALLAGLNQETADLTSGGSATGAGPDWITRNGRWGYLDEDGKFVDKTEVYLNAYQGEPDQSLSDASGGLPETMPAGDESAVPRRIAPPLEELESFEQQPAANNGPSASDLLRSLESPNTSDFQPQGPIEPTEPRLIPAEPDASGPDSPSDNPPAQKSDEEPEPSSQASPPLERPATVRAPIPKGADVATSLDKPADSLGEFSGTLKDLFNRTRRETNVLFSREGVPLDASVKVDGRGKTYNQVIQEALSQNNLRYLIQSDGVPSIVPAPKGEAKPAEEPLPQSRAVDDFIRNPWGDPVAERRGQTISRVSSPTSGLAEMEREALSEDSSLTARHIPEPALGTGSPRNAPAAQSWEVTLQPEALAQAPVSSQSLGNPRGFKSDRLKDEVWEDLLESDLTSLEPMDENGPSAFGLSRHIDQTSTSSVRETGNSMPPRFQTETVALHEPAPEVSAREKRGFWNRLKGIVKPGKTRD